MLFHSIGMIGGKPVLFGEGAKLTDLDWIVLHEKTLSGSAKQCKVSGLGKFSLQSMDALVRIYDRRTGELVEKHTLRGPPPNCRHVGSRTLGETNIFTLGVKKEEVEAWVKEKLEARL